MPTKNMTSLNNFRHRVVLSAGRTEGVNTDDPSSANIVLVRTAVKSVFASISPIKGSFFLAGFAMEENRNAASHYICIRYNRDLDITGFGWIYEDRPSGRRWFKITTVQEMAERERYWQIQARLEQQSDTAIAPAPKKTLTGKPTPKLPQGVKL